MQCSPYRTIGRAVQFAPASKAAGLREVDAPRSLVAHFGADTPLKMDAGVSLGPLTIAYQTYGELNADKSNAILVCHALTGDQHVANQHPITGKPGWWHTMVGPNRPIDTNRYFVIASNVVGGCMGTTGPASLNPATGRPYGLDLPIVTIKDMVFAQAMLIDRLGIATLFCVAGGSMGGMQVLQWVASFPERVFAAMPIATAAKHSSQNIAFHEVGRQAVMADPDWRQGRYLEEGVIPTKGLAVARMAAHITYLSDEALQSKFGRKLQDRSAPTFSFDAVFPDRKLSAPSRHKLCRPLRREFLPLCDEGLRLFRSRRRLRRLPGVRLQGRQNPVLRRVLQFGLALSDASLARDRACLERGRRFGFLCRYRDGSRPRRVFVGHP